jgi:VIT1/CCC1 family predicted Fe2+/Mn2+ transporter
MTEHKPAQNAVDDMPELPDESSSRVLNPMDRIAEILFGLIMVLTYTGSLSVATADHVEIRTMLTGALGCNLAWGIIDAGLYLLARLHERGRKFMLLLAVRKAPDLEAARRVIADALPPLVSAVLTTEKLELMRQKIYQVPKPPVRSQLTLHDGIGAFGIFLLVFLSTFPVAIPFIIISDARLALRMSNAVAIVMLFLCGYAFGHRAGIRPWLMGLSMVAIGIGLVSITIKLGG